MDPLWVYIIIRWRNHTDETPDTDLLRKFVGRIPGVAGQFNGRGPTLRRIGVHDWDGCLDLKKEVDDDPLSRLKAHNWVRILSPGPYRNDIGWLVDLDHARSSQERPLVTVLLVPRVRVRREHPSGVTLLVKTALSPPSGPPVYKQAPIQRLSSEITPARQKGSFELTKNGLLLRAIAPEKVSAIWNDGTPVSPSRFQLRHFIPDLKSHGDVSHQHQVAPLMDEPVRFAEGDKVGLLGRESKTLEFLGILTGVRAGQIWTAKDANEGESGDANSYRLLDEAQMVKFFHPMEYTTSLRDGRSGVVVSIDRCGVATLLVHEKSHRAEKDQQEELRRRGVTRQAGLDEAEKVHAEASRTRNLGRYHAVTEEMRALNQSWTFDFENATEEAARLGSELFGDNFEGQSFCV
jgi:hypothetical protein